ncbi:hypothetical protein [Stenotrophomonas sp. B2]|uniref:hypothetical protein n=1 Tax=Stenotrophomonas sp. B2 TaxID=1537778 RepID=UPI001876D74F|nr:hypothetical protein [Stenotrophomonas sp. B2]MBE5272245.1 hypothetical protein [Stenotrophomonas sp. B2]
MGVVTTAIAMAGSDIPLKCFEAGNVADWLAAAGTWVAATGALAIGYGANRFARETHELRIAQELSDREAALAEKRRRIDVVVLRLRKLKSLPAGFRRMDGGRDYDKLSKSDIDTILRVLKRTIPKVVWSLEEFALLSGPQQLSLASIEMLLDALDEVANMAIEARGSGEQEVLRSSIETAFKGLDNISRRAKELEAEIRRDWPDQVPS